MPQEGKTPLDSKYITHEAAEAAASLIGGKQGTWEIMRLRVRELEYEVVRTVQAGHTLTGSGLFLARSRLYQAVKAYADACLDASSPRGAAGD